MNNFIITRNDNSEKKYFVGISKNGDIWSSIKDYAHKFFNYGEALNILEENHTNDFVRMCMIKIEKA